MGVTRIEMICVVESGKVPLCIDTLLQAEGERVPSDYIVSGPRVKGKVRTFFERLH